MPTKNINAVNWPSDTPSLFCKGIWAKDILTKAGLALCEQCLKQGSHAQRCSEECSIHATIYTPSRIRYPYISAELHHLWCEALAQDKDPVTAWSNMQKSESKRTHYITGRGQNKYVRVPWSEALQLCAASLLYTAYNHGPEYVLGHAPDPSLSVINYVAGTRFLNLLGASCTVHELDFASWSILSMASDWFEGAQKNSQQILNPTQNTMKSPRVLLSWTSGALGFDHRNKNFLDENQILDLHIGIACQHSDAAIHCDIILPSAHKHEFHDISMISTMYFEQMTIPVNAIHSEKYPALIQPQWESKDPWATFQNLAHYISSLSTKDCQYYAQKHNFMDIYNKYTILGAQTVENNIFHPQYDIWDYATKYEILKAQLGVQQHSSALYGMPRVTNCQDACSLMSLLE